MRMVNGYDPAAFDIVREDRERDTRDFRDREFERELERPRRQEERELPEALEEVANNDSIVLTPSIVTGKQCRMPLGHTHRPYASRT